MFTTALRQLKSPQNVGMIVRSHVAFGGREVVFVGYDLPWRFRKGSQAFSRKLERQCEIHHCTDDDAFLAWCAERSYVPIAVEIGPRARSIREFRLPDRAALILGNEAAGLPPSFLERCAHQVFVPQYGAVGSLNVAVAGSIAMLEHAARWGRPTAPSGSRFPGEEHARRP